MVGCVAGISGRQLDHKWVTGTILKWVTGTILITTGSRLKIRRPVWSVVASIYTQSTARSAVVADHS